MTPNGIRANYDYYLYHYKHNFKDMHPFISKHTTHDARHSLITELRKIGVKDHIINSIVGHSNDDIDKDVYTHVSIKEKMEAIKMIKYKEAKKLYVLNQQKQKKTS